MYRRIGQVIHELDFSETTKLSTQVYYTNVWRASVRSREFELENDATELEDDGFATRPRTYETFGIEPKLEFAHRLFGLQHDAVLGIRYHNETIDRQKYELDGSFQGARIFDERLTIDVEEWLTKPRTPSMSQTGPSRPAFASRTWNMTRYRSREIPTCRSIPRPAASPPRFRDSA